MHNQRLTVVSTSSMRRQRVENRKHESLVLQTNYTVNSYTNSIIQDVRTLQQQNKCSSTSETTEVANTVQHANRSWLTHTA